MRYTRIVLFIVIVMAILFGLTTVSLAQTFTLTSNAKEFYNVFLVADLGLKGAGKPNTIFTIDFDGTSDATNYRVRLTGTDLASGQTLLSGITETGKDWNTYFRNKQYTNWNFSDADNLGGDFDLEDTGEKIYDQVLATGYLPSGIFRIALELRDEANTSTIFGPLYVDVTIVPPYMQPLYPVDLQVNRAVLDFRWVSNLRRQELHIFRDPSANKEVLQGSRLPFRGIGGDNRNPGTERVDGSVVAPVLEDGAIYYWQVWGYITTSHGDERAKSTITAFQYFENAEKLEYIGLSDPDKQAIKDLLIEMLKQVVNERAARSINLYDVNRIVLDNSPAMREEIMTILQAIISGDVTATSIQFQ